MQVFFERLIIPRFRMIAKATPGTVLADLCNRLTIDDGIHHRSGMAYERVLLEGADKRTKAQLMEGANRMLPVFVQHVLWRPKAREFVGRLMRDADIRMLREDIEHRRAQRRVARHRGRRDQPPVLSGAGPGSGSVSRWPRKNDARSIGARQDALRARGHDGEVLWAPDRLEPWARATEALTGAAVVPVAVVGPLVVELGEYELEEPSGAVVERGRAAEELFVPLANTEGGLALSMSRGARAVAESGGFRTM